LPEASTIRADCLDLAVDDEDARARQHSGTVEDACVLDKGGLRGLKHRGGRQQQDENGLEVHAGFQYK
jgi:hypothetical protein